MLVDSEYPVSLALELGRMFFEGDALDFCDILSHCGCSTSWPVQIIYQLHCHCHIRLSWPFSSNMFFVQVGLFVNIESCECDFRFLLLENDVFSNSSINFQ